MRIGFLITARLKSTRLPRKLLLDIGGRTVIEHVIDRAKLVSGIDEIILCTSTDIQDDPLIDIADQEGISSFRGSPEDVLERLLNASKTFQLDQFVGITGENALFSVQHAQQMCTIVRANDPDYTYLKGLPIGCATYAAKVNALEVVCQIKKIVDTEIWGYLLNRPELFDIECIDAELTNIDPKMRITLDHPEDEIFFRKVFDLMANKDLYDFNALLALIDAHPELKNIHGHIEQTDLPGNIKEQIDDTFKKHYSEIMALKKKLYGGV